MEKPTLSLRRLRNHRGVMTVALYCALVIFVIAGNWQITSNAAESEHTTFTGPLSSQPLALTADDAFLASVNPDNNSVSFFDLRSDANTLIAEFLHAAHTAI
jgi:hypothetical protein